MQKANGYTRKEVMTAIKLNGSMTADDLARHLGVSPVAVRQHLSALESEGLVLTSVERRGLGRPVHRYTLTDAGHETFPRVYDALAVSLLDELQFWQGEQAVATLFAARNERIKSANSLRLQGKSTGVKVAEIARIQAESGFMASVTEDQGSFLLTENNCAICRVATSHPSVCDAEIALFRDLLGTAVVVDREKHILKGDHACVYRITEAPTAVAAEIPVA